VTGQHDSAYVVVPREPTLAMLNAAWADALAEDAAGVWKAMIENYENSAPTILKIRTAGEADFRVHETQEIGS